MRIDPHTEYERRLQARQAVSRRYERLHVRLGNARVAVAACAALIAWLAFVSGKLSGWWLLAPGAAFVALGVMHDRVLHAKRPADRAVIFYQQGLARIEDRWTGAGETGERYLDDAHLYARDLDLFGRGSVFQLLSTARTRAGEDMLAGWLLEPADAETARARQASVEELRGRLDLREDLAVLGEQAGAGVDPEALAAWGQAATLLDSSKMRLAAAVFSFLAIAGAVLWAAGGHRWLFFLVVGIEAVFAFLERKRFEAVIQQVERPAQDLGLLAEVLARLEIEQFETPLLRKLQAALSTEGRRPSERIRRLNLLIAMLDSRHHVAMRVIDVPLLYTAQLCHAVEAWRRQNGPHVRDWLASVGAIEALSSMAAYAFEHPDAPMPEFTDEAPCFDAEGLAHPLLPQNRSVANDVRLGPDLRVLVVSGSNMSGKSTLLRTIGVNAVLAMAGAPVRARRLRLSPVEVGASIRVVDSLQTGTSRFYAEIRRLKAFVDVAASRPLLFLLDELLHGTNSHDRRIGAEAVVRELVQRGAIGLITTHDLALADIAGAMAGHGANVHFEDHIENGRIFFDYRLRPGVVRKSNALELMRAVGLGV